MHPGSPLPKVLVRVLVNSKYLRHRLHALQTFVHAHCSMAMIEIKLFVSRFIRYFDVVEFVDELKLHERLVAEIANELRVRVREADEVTEAQ